MDDIIEQCASWHRTPFALFGHSMGALVGFELARALRRRRLPAPERLFVSAFRAPHLPQRRPPLHALPSTISINGVFRYGATGFPSTSYQDTNYWVDVVFTTP